MSPSTKILRSRVDGVYRAFEEDYVVIEPMPGWRGLGWLGDPDVHPPFDETYWRNLLPELCRSWNDLPGHRVLKHSPRGRVVAWTLPGCGRAVVCKTTLPTTLRQRMGTRLLGSKAWREFWLGQRLCAAGVATPRPLACLWASGATGGHEGRIVTTALPNPRALDQALRQLAAADCPVAPLRHLSGSLAALLNDLARMKLYHRDLKASNILVTRVDTPDPRPWLIDLDGLLDDRHARGPGFDRSLARLAESLADVRGLSRADRARALRDLDLGGDWRRRWRTVGHLLERRRRRRRQRGRTLADFDP